MTRTGQNGFPTADDEDTIELELTAEELRGLSNAARQAYAAASGSSSKALRATGTGIFRIWPVALAATLVAVAAVISWRPKPPQRIEPRPASRLSVIGVPAVVDHPIVPVAQQAPSDAQQPPGPPVRVRNPFDAAEVFEFPAGTTRAEARQKVAQELLQRAVDRGSPAQAADAEHKGGAAGKSPP